MIDILTVTKRTGWFDIALESLLRQQMDMHWVIVDENLGIKDEHQTMMVNDDFVMMVTFLSAPPKTRPSNLNASLNKGLRFCQTDYVMFYQDFIILEDHTLKTLYLDCLENENSFITTVTRNPKGEKEDLRYLGVDCLRPCRPEEWETNVAFAYMPYIHTLGGFDERLDEGWSWDNVNLAERAAMLGWKFYLDERIRPQLLHHPKEKWLETNGERNARILDAMRSGREPIKLPYLSEVPYE